MIREDKSRPLINLLQKHYDVPLFCAYLDYRNGTLVPNLYGVTPIRESLNLVYQARYGLFTCANSHQYSGMLPYNTDLIGLWEPNAKHIAYMWYFSIAYAIKEGVISFEDDLRPFKKPFQQKNASNSKKEKIVK